MANVNEVVVERVPVAGLVVEDEAVAAAAAVIASVLEAAGGAEVQIGEPTELGLDPELGLDGAGIADKAAVEIGNTVDWAAAGNFPYIAGNTADIAVDTTDLG